MRYELIDLHRTPRESITAAAVASFKRKITTPNAKVERYLDDIALSNIALSNAVRVSEEGMKGYHA